MNQPGNKLIIRIYSILFIAALNVVFFRSSCMAVNPYDNWAMSGTVLSVYPAYYSADKLKDNKGNNSNTDLKSRSNQVTTRVTYYNKSILPNTLGFTLCLPAGRKGLLGKHDSGIGDLTFALGYWFIDDPAVKTFILAGSYFDAPTGDFDKSRTVNMGKNVWKIRPVLAAAKQLGKFDTELSLFYNIYGRNKDNGLEEGSETIFEAYTGYSLKPGLMLGGNLNATFGLDKKSYGTRVNDSAVRRFQAGPSLYWKISKSSSITLSALAEFGVSNSSEGYYYSGRYCWKL